ncbi:ComE operon protein 1 [Clostridiales bacterium CHKCI001]|nr:ComE operon protein 1 [Clostridiales bacterium CHKCI001]
MKTKEIIQYLVIAVGIVIAGLVYYNINEQPSWEVTGSTAVETEQLQQSSKTVSQPSVICVHICGAVNNPGVYEGEASLRLYQFIELAGGFREDASVESLNLAQGVQDGMQIYVPSKQEAVEPPALLSSTENNGKNAKLNLNTASKSELTQLPGIGEVKAEAILSYRDTNGAFQTIEELMNIPGIKEATFEQIKDLITVTN